DLEKWTRQVVQQVIGSSIPLPDDLAHSIGSPEEVERLLTGKTIGWLVSREETQPNVHKAVEQSTEVQRVFQEFFDLQETTPFLQERAQGQIGKNENTRLAQTF